MNPNENPKAGDLQVWWIPQVPGEPFLVPVKNIRESKLVLDALARYDTFQLEQNIKGDFSNAGGLNVYSLDIDGDKTPGWETWYNEDGDGIDEVDDDGTCIDG